MDFGGAVEKDEDLIYSAAREWAEETLGLFLTLKYLYQKREKGKMKVFFPPPQFPWEQANFSQILLILPFTSPFPFFFFKFQLFWHNRYNKETEKQDIDKCTQHSLQILQSSPNLYPLQSAYNYNLFFYKIPYQDLHIIDEEFLNSFTKRRKFWWVSAKDLLAGNIPLKLYARLGVIKQKLDGVISEIIKDNNASL